MPMTKKKPATECGAGGRPTAFHPYYCEKVVQLCKLGAKDTEIAEFFDVDVSTMYRWQQAHPEFREAIKEGKMLADMAVVSSLHKRALGYEWDEAQPIKVKEVLYENGKRIKETERVEIVMVRKVMPPETTANIFWLKNRRRADWRDKADVDVNVTVNMTDDQLNRRIAELTAKASATTDASTVH